MQNVWQLKQVMEVLLISTNWPNESELKEEEVTWFVSAAR